MRHAIELQGRLGRWYPSRLRLHIDLLINLWRLANHTTSSHSPMLIFFSLADVVEQDGTAIAAESSVSFTLATFLIA